MNSNHFMKTTSLCMLACAITLAAAAASVLAQTPETAVDQKDSVASSSSETKNEDSGNQTTPSKDEVAEAQAPKKALFENAAPSSNPFAVKTSDVGSPQPAAQASGSEWQFAFTPYLYMTGMTGTIGARGQSAEIDLDFTDVVEHLNLGLMGTLEARKGRFVTATDLMWIKLGEERETPGGLFSSVKVGVNLLIFDPEIGYRLYDGKAGSFDVLGGLRIMSVENNVNFRAGTLPAMDSSERKTWATPVIGGHGIVNLTPKFFLGTKFDIGGGVGADFTGQFYGGAGYRLRPNIALLGGYRYLKTDYDSEAGFIFNTTMSGILLGAKFSF